MDLTELVAEMVKEQRHPEQIIRAHKLTLDALTAIAGRLIAAERELQELARARRK
jgi:hypothetical protein